MAFPQANTGGLSFGQEIGLLVSLLDHQQLDAYANLAATAFYVWDMILTTNDEITYIWGSRTSTVKVVYFLNRYTAHHDCCTVCVHCLVDAFRGAASHLRLVERWASALLELF